MNSVLTKILIFLTFFILQSCSYKPIFVEKDYNFEIENLYFTGEKEINREIENKLNLIKNNEDPLKKKYTVFIESKMRREIVSNDSKGDPLKFEMFILVNLTLKENEKLILNKNIEKKNIYNNNSDKFELEKNEKIILENLSDKISDNIISSIINVNDN